MRTQTRGERAFKAMTLIVIAIVAVFVLFAFLK